MGCSFALRVHLTFGLRALLRGRAACRGLIFCRNPDAYHTANSNGQMVFRILEDSPQGERITFAT